MGHLGFHEQKNYHKAGIIIKIIHSNVLNFYYYLAPKI